MIFYCRVTKKERTQIERGADWRDMLLLTGCCLVWVTGATVWFLVG